MNKHEEEDWLKQNPGGDIEDYRQMKKQKRLKNNDGGLSSLKEQRDKLLNSDDQVVSIISLLCINWLINRVSKRLRATSRR